MRSGATALTRKSIVDPLWATGRNERTLGLSLVAASAEVAITATSKSAMATAMSLLGNRRRFTACLLAGVGPAPPERPSAAWLSRADARPVALRTRLTAGVPLSGRCLFATASGPAIVGGRRRLQPGVSALD